jgi:hypothetical protein
MKNLIYSLLFTLAAIVQANAQQDNQVQSDTSQTQDEMVCFLTDENTITCFVAPEEEAGTPNSNDRNAFEEGTVPAEPEEELKNESESPNSSQPDNQKKSRKERKKDRKQEEEAAEEYEPGDVKMI